MKTILVNVVGLFVASPLRMALHKKSWAVVDRPYNLGFAIVGALYERPRSIFCAKGFTDTGNNLCDGESSGCFARSSPGCRGRPVPARPLRYWKRNRART